LLPLQISLSIQRLSPAALKVGLFALSLHAAHATMELTPDNFDEVVFKSGKSAFVKFLAPW